MPVPLASIQHGADSIWGREVELKSKNRILLNAASGKGKSTFTSILAGIRNDYEGQLIIDGRNSQELSADEWTKLRKEQLSFVFQDLQLFPKLSVKENLQIKNQLTDTFRDDQLKEMLDYLGIQDKWEQKCGLLSMGQQQRVAIIRALCQPYEWLIMDEPFSHLDVANALRALELIDNRTKEQNSGFVLTSLGDSHQFNYDYELKL